MNAPHADGCTVLHLAVQKNREQVVQLLIQERGVDVNAKQDFGWTALHFGAQNGFFNILNMLTDKGADVNARTKDGWTPLHYAAQGGFVDVAQVLIRKGADVNAKDLYGFSPLHIAARNGHLDLTQVLIKTGANVNLKADNGWTALHDAAQYGFPKVFDLLIKEGAHVNTNNKGLSILEIVVTKWSSRVPQWEMIYTLLKKGAIIDVRILSGRSSVVVKYLQLIHLMSVLASSRIVRRLRSPGCSFYLLPADLLRHHVVETLFGRS